MTMLKQTTTHQISSRVQEGPTMDSPTVITVTMDSPIIMATMDSLLIIITMDSQIIMATMEGPTMDSPVIAVTMGSPIIMATMDSPIVIITMYSQIIVATMDRLVIVIMVTMKTQAVNRAVQIMVTSLT